MINNRILSAERPY